MASFSAFQIFRHLVRSCTPTVIVIVIATFASALAELATLGLATAFASQLLAANPSTTVFQQFFSIIVPFDGDDLFHNFVALCFLYGCACLLRLALIHLLNLTSAAIGNQLSAVTFSNLLNQPLEFFLAKDESQLVSAIVLKVNHVIGGIVIPAIQIISSGVISTTVIVYLGFTQPPVFLIAVLMVGILYLAIFVVIKSTLRSKGAVASDMYSLILEHIRSSLGLIRYLKMEFLQRSYSRHFQTMDKIQRGSQAQISTLSSAPRFLVEALIVLFLPLFVFFTTDIAAFNDQIASMLVFAFATQRVLPLAQQIFSGAASIQATLKAGKDLMEVDQVDRLEPVANNGRFEPITSFGSFDRLVIEDVNFGFKNRKLFDGVCFQIPLRTWFGIYGQSGRGKSTLIDLLLGLTPCHRGSITFASPGLAGPALPTDPSVFALVPQETFIINGSLEQNIRLGREIDEVTLEKIIGGCELSELRRNLGKQVIGENGRNLSGGQKQRIAIARALASRKHIIVLDEATAALDEPREQRILQFLKEDYADTTFIIVTHKQSLKKFFDDFVDLDEL